MSKCSPNHQCYVISVQNMESSQAKNNTMGAENKSSDIHLIKKKILKSVRRIKMFKEFCWNETSSTGKCSSRIVSSFKEECSSIQNSIKINPDIILKRNIKDNISQTQTEIYTRDTLVVQLKNLMAHGIKTQSDFIGSPAYLEIQRLLLYTEKTSEASQIYTEPVIPTKPVNILPAEITVSGLRCCIHSEPSKIALDCSTYYVLLISHYKTVHATEISKVNKFGWIDFSKVFVFKNVTEHFKIAGELYALRLSTKRGFKSLFNTCYKMPQLKLIGKITLNIKNASKGVLTFRHNNGYSYQPHKLKFTIGTSIEWPEQCRGFLKIGIEKPGVPLVWYQRWCVLKGSDIIHYTYPCEENYENTGRTISLAECVSCELMRNIYPKRKSLVLNINGSKNIILTPDPQLDIPVWKRHIDLIIHSIAFWNMNK